MSVSSSPVLKQSTLQSRSQSNPKFHNLFGAPENGDSAEHKSAVGTVRDRIAESNSASQGLTFMHNGRRYTEKSCYEAVLVANGLDAEEMEKWDAVGEGGEERKVRKIATVETVEMFQNIGFKRIVGLKRFVGLRVLRVICQGIQTIEGLETLTALETLDLSDNRIERIGGGLVGLVRLQKLYLDHNRIVLLEGLDTLRELRVLSVAANEIRHITGLAHNKNIHTLNLADNHIEQVGGRLRHLYALTDLNLSANRIGTFHEIRELGKLKSVRVLHLFDPHWGVNPVCNLCNYHTYCLYHMRHVQIFDSITVSAEARQLAEGTFLKKQMFYQMRMKMASRCATTLCSEMHALCRKEISQVNRDLRGLVALVLHLQQEMEVVRFLKGLDDQQKSLFLSQLEKNESKDLPALRISLSEEKRDSNGSSTSDNNESNSSSKVKSRRDRLSALFFANMAEWETRTAESLSTVQSACGVLFFTRKMLQNLATAGSALIRVWEREALRRLAVELGSGGNVRFEVGTSSQNWYNVCAAFVRSHLLVTQSEEKDSDTATSTQSADKHSRDYCSGFAPHCPGEPEPTSPECISMLSERYSVCDIRIKSVTKIYDRFLRNEFESAVDAVNATPDPLAELDKKRKNQGNGGNAPGRNLKYLFARLPCAHSWSIRGYVERFVPPQLRKVFLDGEEVDGTQRDLLTAGPRDESLWFDVHKRTSGPADVISGAGPSGKVTNAAGQHCAPTKRHLACGQDERMFTHFQDCPCLHSFDIDCATHPGTCVTGDCESAASVSTSASTPTAAKEGKDNSDFTIPEVNLPPVSSFSGNQQLANLMYTLNNVSLLGGSSSHVQNYLYACLPGNQTSRSTSHRKRDRDTDGTDGTDGTPETSEKPHAQSQGITELITASRFAGKLRLPPPLPGPKGLDGDGCAVGVPSLPGFHMTLSNSLVHDDVMKLEALLNRDAVETSRSQTGGGPGVGGKTHSDTAPGRGGQWHRMNVHANALEAMLGPSGGFNALEAMEAKTVVLCRVYLGNTCPLAYLPPPLQEKVELPQVSTQHHMEYHRPKGAAGLYAMAGEDIAGHCANGVPSAKNATASTENSKKKTDGAGGSNGKKKADGSASGSGKSTANSTSKSTTGSSSKRTKPSSLVQPYPNTVWVPLPTRVLPSLAHNVEEPNNAGMRALRSYFSGGAVALGGERSSGSDSDSGGPAGSASDSASGGGKDVKTAPPDIHPAKAPKRLYILGPGAYVIPEYLVSFEYVRDVRGSAHPLKRRRAACRLPDRIQGLTTHFPIFVQPMQDFFGLLRLAKSSAHGPRQLWKLVKRRMAQQSNAVQACTSPRSELETSPRAPVMKRSNADAVASSRLVQLLGPDCNHFWALVPEKLKTQAKSLVWVQPRGVVGQKSGQEEQKNSEPISIPSSLSRIDRFRAVTSLALVGLGLTSVPSSVLRLPKLSCLDLSFNQLSTFPNGSTEMKTGISALFLSYNRINNLSAIRRVAETCPDLQVLFLVGNPVATFGHDGRRVDTHTTNKTPRPRQPAPLIPSKPHAQPSIRQYFLMVLSAAPHLRTLDGLERWRIQAELNASSMRYSKNMVPRVNKLTANPSGQDAQSSAESRFKAMLVEGGSFFVRKFDALLTGNITTARLTTSKLLSFMKSTVSSQRIVSSAPIHSYGRKIRACLQARAAQDSTAVVDTHGKSHQMTNNNASLGWFRWMRSTPSHPRMSELRQLIYHPFLLSFRHAARSLNLPGQVDKTGADTHSGKQSQTVDAEQLIADLTALFAEKPQSSLQRAGGWLEFVTVLSLREKQLKNIPIQLLNGGVDWALQVLDLSKNEISGTEGLSVLSCLCTLNLAHNRLTSFVPGENTAASTNNPAGKDNSASADDDKLSSGSSQQDADKPAGEGKDGGDSAGSGAVFSMRSFFAGRRRSQLKNASKPALTGLAVHRFACLSRLELAGNRIRSLVTGGVSVFRDIPNLSYLSLEGNMLTSLQGLGCCSQLMELYAGNNRISAASNVTLLKQMPKLLICDLSGNPVTTAVDDYRLFTVFHAPRLKVLDGSPVSQESHTLARSKFSGRLTHLMVRNMVTRQTYAKIKVLELVFQRLRVVDILTARNFPRLQTLVLDRNLISNVGTAFSPIPTLRVLSLSRNKIATVSTSTAHNNNTGNTNSQPTGLWSTLFPRLEKLVLSHNRIQRVSALNLRGLLHLTQLDLSGNDIQRIEGLEAVPTLQSLDLSGNRIKRLDPKSFVGCDHLVRLSLAENALRTIINLGPLPMLHTLNLQQNRLTDLGELDHLVPEKACPMLSELSLGGNGLCRKHLFRRFVLCKLRQVCKLDGVVIPEQEREQLLQESGMSRSHFAQQPPPTNTLGGYTQPTHEAPSKQDSKHNVPDFGSSHHFGGGSTTENSVHLARYNSMGGGGGGGSSGGGVSGNVGSGGRYASSGYETDNQHSHPLSHTSIHTHPHTHPHTSSPRRVVRGSSRQIRSRLPQIFSSKGSASSGYFQQRNTAGGKPGYRGGSMSVSGQRVSGFRGQHARANTTGNNQMFGMTVTPRRRRNHTRKYTQM